VGLSACFEEGCVYDGAKPGIGTVDLIRRPKVSLTRPTGRKAPRRPGMPETMRMVAVSTQSQQIGEFLEWLESSTELVIGAYDGTGRLWPSYPSIQELLARYYGIDLDRVDRERMRLLAWMRKKGSA
jgi:hypothetical protein